MHQLVSQLRFASAVLVARFIDHETSLPDPRPMVLAATDLSPSWQFKSARTFRTGLVAHSTPVAERLRKARGISHVIAYTDAKDPGATIISQATPFSGAEDASAALATVEQHFLSNLPWSTVETQRRGVTLPVAVGDQHRAFLLESASMGMEEPSSQAQQLLVAWCRGSVLGTLAVSGSIGRFHLGDLVDLALRQDERIRQAKTGA